MCFIDPSTMHERLQCQVVTIRVTSLSVSSADTLYRRHGIDVVSFGNSLHDPDCYYLIRTFDSAEKWLRFSMLFTQALTGAAAHAKALFAASKPALKQ